MLLATVEGRLVARWVPDHTFIGALDAVSLAPGYRDSEEHVGTSGIGLALEQQCPVFVTGPEHFAEALVTWGGVRLPRLSIRARDGSWAS